MIDLSQIASTLKLFGLVFSVFLIGYAGLEMQKSDDPIKRNDSKQIIVAVLVGLSILFIAPLVASYFIGGNYCTP